MAVPGKAPGAIGPGQAAVFGPTSMTDTSRLGGAPRNGDFAQLLERASQPDAHRMHAQVAPAAPERALDARSQPVRDAQIAVRPAQPVPQPTTALDLSAVGDRASSVLKRWSAKPPRERIVTGLIAIGIGWFVINLLSSLVSGADDHLGLLAVAALFIFFVLRQRAGRRSSR